jgi:hypothetical protein
MVVRCERAAMVRDRCSTRIKGLPGGNVADCLAAAVCAIGDLLRTGTRPWLAQRERIVWFRYAKHARWQEISHPSQGGTWSVWGLKNGVFFEHCAEATGECVERTKLYVEPISAGWMAPFARPYAKLAPTFLNLWLVLARDQ